MYRPPHVKRDSKKPQAVVESSKKGQHMPPRQNLVAKNRDMSSKQLRERRESVPVRKTIPQKVEHLQRVVEKLNSVNVNPKMQQMLLDEIRGIKTELREIKQQIGLGDGHRDSHQRTDDEQQEQPRQISSNLTQNYESALQQSNRGNQWDLGQQSKVQKPNQQLQRNRSQQRPVPIPAQKQLLDIGKIQPYLKDFKLDPAHKMQPYYTGYHKKSSRPIIVKYCLENKTMNFQIQMYEKLWKNIVKAKRICINKLYDLNEPLATNIMVLERNKAGLTQIQRPAKEILIDVLRALQFIHECGYLYRNVHPSHIMANQQNDIVLIDFKQVKRFVDMKGKILQVKGNNSEEILDEFTANSRLRNALQGRKDDLQTLGYLAIYLLEGKLPWTTDNMMQMRPKMTLQQLYGKYGTLLEFMIRVHKMGHAQCPNYDELHQLLAS